MTLKSLDGISPGRYFITILQVLGSKGRTISEIQSKKVKYMGDPNQSEYSNRSVWHDRDDVEARVAERLKLDKRIVIGKKRSTNKFKTQISRQIIRLRKKGYLKDWNVSKRISIYRLAKPVDELLNTFEERVLEKERIFYLKKDISTNPEQNMMNKFVNIMIHGRKDTTYKFALARAMLDYCKNHPEDETIQYKDLATLFLKYYWHQGYRFKIKQSFKLDEPNVINIIENIFKDDKKKKFSKINPAKKETAIRLIMDKVFGNTIKKKGVVISAFHTVKGSSEETFYEYSDELKQISLKPGVAQFFQDNYYVLLMTTIAEWAKFLEKSNYSLPRLVSKVERENEKRNSNLSRFKTIYKHQCRCFYCNNELTDKNTQVDHFIPWSYMFDDDAWNMVLSCKICNCDKSNSLPKIKFKEKLLDRNRKYHKCIEKLRDSIEILEKSGKWEDEIEKHYKLCQEYKFDIWDKEFVEDTKQNKMALNI